MQINCSYIYTQDTYIEEYSRYVCPVHQYFFYFMVENTRWIIPQHEIQEKN